MIDRVAELVDADPEIHVTFEFHGGEPLLFGRKRFADLMGQVRARLPSDRLTCCLQTNGVLLDDAWCEFFALNKVHWSLSADGPATVHDQFRVFQDGRPSHAAVEAAIQLSLSRPEWAPWFGGVLAVVNPDAGGAAVVRYFHGLCVRNLDLLLPDATHAAAPAHLSRFSQNRLLRFMTDAFEAWVTLDDPRFRIRLFEHLALGMMGREPQLDSLGAGLDWLTVVETDGTYQLLDVLHTCGEQYTITGGHLRTRSLAEQFAWQRTDPIPPCATCRACRSTICAAGAICPPASTAAALTTRAYIARRCTASSRTSRHFSAASYHPACGAPERTMPIGHWT